VSNPVPDARRAGPGIAWKERRTAPCHAAVWVRLGGQWRRGRIIESVRQIDLDDSCVEYRLRLKKVKSVEFLCERSGPYHLGHSYITDSIYSSPKS
jgi:hypothetical protein